MNWKLSLAFTAATNSSQHNLNAAQLSTPTTTFFAAVYLFTTGVAILIRIVIHLPTVAQMLQLDLVAVGAGVDGFSV